MYETTYEYRLLKIEYSYSQTLYVRWPLDSFDIKWMHPVVLLIKDKSYQNTIIWAEITILDMLVKIGYSTNDQCFS